MLTIDPTIFGGLAASRGYNAVITIILLVTVIFANFAEAVAEGRGRAQAAALRRVHKETRVKRLSQPKYGSKYEIIASSALPPSRMTLTADSAASAWGATAIPRRPWIDVFKLKSVKSWRQ